eukprot:3745306-Pyramimonas_sp.AAC.1
MPGASSARASAAVGGLPLAATGGVATRCCAPRVGTSAASIALSALWASFSSASTAADPLSSP